MRKISLLTVLYILIFIPFGCAQDEDPYYSSRMKMVQEQIRERGVKDTKVLAVMEKVKRHIFVPAWEQYQAYEDYPVPIGYRQTISQPYIVAYMTEAAELKKDDKVLEIGTGSGYQAAILAEIVNEVYTIEIIKELADSARDRLKELGYKNIWIRHGDGYEGWEEYAPFDAIIVTAAPDEIPQKLVHQLKVGGRMIVPVGDFYQELQRITKTESGFEVERLLPVRFVPMIKK